jgi:hypothetical protein
MWHEPYDKTNPEISQLDHGVNWKGETMFAMQLNFRLKAVFS